MLDMPKHVRYEVGANWRELTQCPGFPPSHWPRDVGHGARVEIVFDAPPGQYTFTLAQLPTGQAETVAVLVDGRKVGAFSTVAGKLTDHRIGFALKAGGRHTLTLGEFKTGGGYGIDAVKLERVRPG